MKKLIGLVALLSLSFVMGCSTETTQSDLDAEKKQIEKQTPKDLEPAQQYDDMKTMGGPSGEGSSNVMPKGTRGK